MSNESNESLTEALTYRRRTIMGALAAGGSLAAFGTAGAQARQVEEDWLPEGASEAHVAVLSGTPACTQTNAGGCAHITPLEADTLGVDVVIENIECVTQAHIHEGGRDEDGPIVATLFEYTAEPDGSGPGDPISTTAETPLIEGTTIDDAELVEDILTNPEAYYVNVHTVHNPDGEIRGQIRGFDLGQETELDPQAAEFHVSDLDPRHVSVVHGERFDVSATVRNAGDLTDTQTVELHVDGDVVAQERLELACRQASTVTFSNVEVDRPPGEYEFQIRTEDDFETGTLTILDPPEFEVSELDPRDVTVTQGDRIDVSARVENVGQATGTQTVEFRVGDAGEEPHAFEVVDEQELTLDGGQAERVEFVDVETAEFDPGEYEHGIFTEDDFEIGTLTIEAEPEPAEFTVSNLDPVETTVTRGESLEVSAAIENVGDEEGTQTIELRIGEDIEEAVEVALTEEQELTLDAGEEQEVVFEDIDTAPLDPGEYEHGIVTEDDSETGTLTVEAEPEPAEFSVLDLEPMEAEVTQGETFDVESTIQNTGETDGTQTVELRVDDDVLDEEEVTLDPDESELVIFTDVETADLEPGEYEHGVYTEDDELIGTLTVAEDEAEPEPAEFSVLDLEPMEAEVTQETFDVESTIQNTGETAGTQTVELRVNGDALDEEEVTLDPDESELVIFTDVETADLEPGEYEHGVYTEDDELTGTLTVAEDEAEPEPAEFSVLDLDPMEAEVTQGETFDVQSTIQNTGETDGTQTVELRANGQVLASEELPLDPDEAELVIFTGVETADLEPGEYEHGVYTEDDEQTGTLSVLPTDGEE